MTVSNCPICGGTHFGEHECPFLEVKARRLCREAREASTEYDGASDLHAWVNEMWSEYTTEARAEIAIEGMAIRFCPTNFEQARNHHPMKCKNPCPRCIAFVRFSSKAKENS